MTQLPDVKINKDSMEPRDYFEIVKGDSKDVNEELLKANLKVVARNILDAKSINQESFVNQLSYTFETLKKEQILVASGFTKAISRELVNQNMDKVEPKGSVKWIELERFPRAIPPESRENIAKAQRLGIFDEFLVAFTDFTNNTYATKAEQAVVRRNRDPIVFGGFKDTELNIRHDRLYFIADWEDDYCDLTFHKLVNKLSKLDSKGTKQGVFDLGVSDKYLTDLVETQLSDARKKNTRPEYYPEPGPRKKKRFGIF